jgi:hypothetical protein
MEWEYVQWLTAQNLPMFDIRKCRIEELWDGKGFKGPTIEVDLRDPPMKRRFTGDLKAPGGIDRAFAAIIAAMPPLDTEVGRMAVRRALADLTWTRCWWDSAGPITEECRGLLRMALIAYGTAPDPPRKRWERRPSVCDPPKPAKKEGSVRYRGGAWVAACPCIRRTFRKANPSLHPIPLRQPLEFPRQPFPPKLPPVYRL